LLGLFIRFLFKMGREMKMTELPFYIAIAAFPVLWYVIAWLLPVSRQELRMACMGALADLEAPEGLVVAVQNLGRSSSRRARKAARALVRAVGESALPEDYDRVGPHVMSHVASRAADKRDWDLVQVVQALGRHESIAAMERLLRRTEPGRRRQKAQSALEAAKARAEEAESAQGEQV
jgi:integrase